MKHYFQNLEIIKFQYAFYSFYAMRNSTGYTLSGEEKTLGWLFLGREQGWGWGWEQNVGSPQMTRALGAARPGPARLEGKVLAKHTERISLSGFPK